MNKYVRAGIDIVTAQIKTLILKALPRCIFSCGKLARIAPTSEIIVHRNGTIKIGERVRMDARSTFSVQTNAVINIGNNVSFGVNNMVICHELISIGNNVQFSPNVLVYDHDHDYRVRGGISAMQYKTAPIVIGDNVWIGANTVILKGSMIGDNCVIGAGSIVKGKVPNGVLFVQKRENIMVEYEQ